VAAQAVGGGGEPDLLREMVQTFAETLMGADADDVCGDRRV
jgi:transposase-like protein